MFLDAGQCDASVAAIAAMKALFHPSESVEPLIHVQVTGMTLTLIAAVTAAELISALLPLLLQSDYSSSVITVFITCDNHRPSTH